MFFDEHTPTTNALSSFAICTANWPTPPDAPSTSTRRSEPDACLIRPRSTTDIHAVTPGIGSAPAMAMSTESGTRHLVLTDEDGVGIEPRCPREKSVPPTTRSRATRVTWEPTESTTPAKSTPTTTWGFGPNKRAASRSGPELRIFQSTGFTPMAWTLTRTSRFPGSGVGSSMSSSRASAAQSRCPMAFTTSSSVRPHSGASTKPLRWPLRNRNQRDRNQKGHGMTKRQVTALLVLCLAVFMAAVDGTVISVAVPAITEQLHPGYNQILWIGDVYSFVLAGLLITMGNVGPDRPQAAAADLQCRVRDCLGRRGVRPTAGLLIVARVVQGVAGAGLMPSTLALLRTVFTDDRQRTRAVGIWSASGAGGAALGPTVAGVLP